MNDTILLFVWMTLYLVWFEVNMIDILVWFYIPRPFGALIALELLQDLGLRIALRLGVVHCTALGWCGIQQVC